MAFPGKIGIVGAGALGGLYGARFLHAGDDVHFLMRSDAEHVRQHGMEVRSWQGDFTVQPKNVYTTPEQLGPCDFILVGLKATNNGSLAKILPPMVNAKTVILTLQNGFGNEDAIINALKASHPNIADRVIGGVSFLCCNRIGHGKIDHISRGDVRIAAVKEAGRQYLPVLKELFERANFPCSVEESVPRVRWEKLMWNIPFNGLGVAAHHASTEIIIKDEVLLSTARAMIAEAAAAAKAADGIDITDEFKERMITITRDAPDYRTSMQLDFEAGNPLEVEAILGEPYRKGTNAGVAMPLVGFVYTLVKRLDPANKK